MIGQEVAGCAKDPQCKVGYLQNGRSWQKQLLAQKIWEEINKGTQKVGQIV